MEFIDHLTQAVKRQIIHNQSPDILFLQLAYQNASVDCRQLGEKQSQ